jgi:LPXTG-site transpeptidase (sortase) family protein
MKIIKKIKKLAKKTHQQFKPFPSGSLILTLLFIIIFIFWTFTTLIPVLVVELKYNTNKLMMSMFNTTSIKAIFIPDFSHWTIEGYSSHKQYGIRIPEIFIDQPVVFNVDPNNPKQYKQALKKGIAHASGTALPGETGLGYYFAHSSSIELLNQRNAIFYLLGKLEIGNDVYIWHERERYHYKVNKRDIVKANDVTFFDKNYDTETIVLQTCWPVGTTRKRLLIYAQRVYN